MLYGCGCCGGGACGCPGITRLPSSGCGGFTVVKVAGAGVAMVTVGGCSGGGTRGGRRRVYSWWRSGTRPEVEFLSLARRRVLNIIFY